MSTFFEMDIAKKNYIISNQDFLNNNYKKKFNSIEDVNKNRIASYYYNYKVFNSKIYLDFFILIIICILFFLEHKFKNN